MKPRRTPLDIKSEDSGDTSSEEEDNPKSENDSLAPNEGNSSNNQLSSDEIASSQNEESKEGPTMTPSVRKSDLRSSRLSVIDDDSG